MDTISPSSAGLTSVPHISQVQLSVAQIDTVYSQHALLQLVAFLNEGYPPPSLDPLMVRASITLAEIVRERLLQPRAKLHALKSQQSQLHLEVGSSHPAQSFLTWSCWMTALTASNCMVRNGILPSSMGR